MVKRRESRERREKTKWKQMKLEMMAKKKEQRDVEAKGRCLR